MQHNNNLDVTINDIYSTVHDKILPLVEKSPFLRLESLVELQNLFDAVNHTIKNAIVVAQSQKDKPFNGQELQTPIGKTCDCILQISNIVSNQKIDDSGSVELTPMNVDTLLKEKANTIYILSELYNSIVDLQMYITGKQQSYN